MGKKSRSEPRAPAGRSGAEDKYFQLENVKRQNGESSGGALLSGSPRFCSVRVRRV